jgi:hypothetical protein
MPKYHLDVRFGPNADITRGAHWRLFLTHPAISRLVAPTALLSQI